MQRKIIHLIIYSKSPSRPKFIKHALSCTNPEKSVKKSIFIINQKMVKSFLKEAAYIRNILYLRHNNLE